MAALDIMRRGSRVYIVLSYDNEPDAIVAYNDAQSARLDTQGKILIDAEGVGWTVDEPIADITGLK